MRPAPTREAEREARADTGGGGVKRRLALPLSARRVRVALGFLWLLDAGLQAQPHLFTAGWWRDDLAQSVMGLPGSLNAAILWAVGVVASHPAAWNALFVAVQAAMGLALVTGRGERWAIAASVPWALGVWFVGEGLGTLPGGFGLFAAGAPGPVLYYPLLGILAWPRRPASQDRVSAPRVPARPAAVTWAVLWVGGAILELADPFAPARVIEANVEESSLGAPGWLAGPSRFAYHAVAAHPLLVPALLACAQVAVGVAIARRATPRLGLAAGIALSLLFWVVPQSLGTLPAGNATDPGAAPLVILLALALWPPRGVTAAAPARLRYSNDGLRSRLRLSSKKPSTPLIRTKPSHSRPAASPLGAGVTTGPKKALPCKRMTGVPTSMPTWSKASWWERLISSSRSSLPAASDNDSGSPTSISASGIALGSSRRPSTWKRVPMAV